MKILFSFILLGFISSPVFAQSNIGDEEFLQKMESELDSLETKAPSREVKPSASAPLKNTRVVRKLRKKRKAAPTKPVVEATPGYIPDNGAPPKNPSYSSGYFEGDRRYGKYRISLGAANMEFTDDKFKSIYKKRYGGTKYYPKLTVDWMPYSGVIGLGMRFGVGYYSASGKALDPTSTLENIVLSSLKTRMRLYPLQVGLNLAYNPFHNSTRWVNFQGWVGFEKLYHSDSFPNAGEGNKTFIAKGNKDMLFYGGSLNFGLNFLDPESVNSMRAIGLGYLYLSVSYEMVSSLEDKDDELAFDRSSLGFAFTFESSI